MGFFNTVLNQTGLGRFAAGEDAANIFANQAELGIDEIREQLERTQGQLDPFIEAGTGAIPGVQQGTSLAGIDERLGEIFGGQNFQNLRDERTRAIQGQLAAGGLTRSGTALQEIANVPTELGFSLENVLQNRLSNLAGGGQSSAVTSGQFGANAAGSIANLRTGIGARQAEGFLFDEKAQAAGVANMTNSVLSFGGLVGSGSVNSPLAGEQQGFGGSQGGGGGAGDAGQLIGIASMFFSDPRLKENIRKIGQIKGLGLFKWDWVQKAKETIIGTCGTTGFMSNEVKALYPQYVYEFAGFDVIDYPNLLNELKEAS